MPEDNKPASSSAPSLLTSLTKRQQVEKTNKNIFLWVASAAVVVSLSIVLMQFLVREGLFNMKIISAQQETERILKQSKEEFPKLKSNIDALLADDGLSALRVDPSKDSSLQVILDALPTSGDPTSFANSLYNKVLSRQSVTITSVSVGADSGAVPGVAAPTGTGSTAQPISFGASISGSRDQIQATLLDIEKVIRPISLKQLTITAGGSTLEVNMQGETYFLPRTTVALGNKLVKP